MARDRSGSLTGFACQAPSLGPYVPSSVLTDLRAEHQRYAAAHWPPAQRLPPSAPGPLSGAAGSGPPLLRGFGPPPEASPLRRGPPAPGSAGLGLSPPSRRPSLRRRPGPPPPTRGATPRLRSRRGTRSWGSPLGGSGWTWRSALRASAGSPRPFCAPSRRVPPGRPRPRPALPRPSVGWSPGRATGSAPPAWGLSRSPEGTAL